jgi:hypothetical protein
MNKLSNVEYQIEITIERLKEIETVEYRNYIISNHGIERYNISRQIVTDIFRGLLLKRDELCKQKKE